MSFESDGAAKAFYDGHARRTGFLTRIVSSCKSGMMDQLYPIDWHVTKKDTIFTAGERLGNAEFESERATGKVVWQWFS
ncbi:hypothetical protein RHMOL_Rhmol02G0088300 [Rhododendron molle]|uniref:Uncharacterized protein n=1 Tax=Rhododendron molle TaxID=49168 RepID=A0ACC0PQC8_RHOML|nr:hypothetical protein RHMOL_Rhmol02G0088300 [Rhododendron molle]